MVNALQSLDVRIQKQDVQVELTNLVHEATAFSRNVVSVPGRDVERSEFLAEFREQSRLGKRLSPGQFEQLFTTIVLARYRYLEDRYLEDLVSLNPLHMYLFSLQPRIANRLPSQPVENPATHCHLARAVDAFEKAAWFWSSVEAFLEDDQGRGDDIEGDNTLPSGSGENRQDLPATSSAVNTISSATSAAGNVGFERR